MERGERHGLFLIYVLAGFQGGHEVLAVQVLRRSNQHSVDALVVEEISIIQIGLCVRGELLGIFESFGEDIGEAHNFRIGAFEGRFHIHRALRARSDDTQPDPFVGAEYRGRRDDRSCNTGHGCYKFAA